MQSSFMTVTENGNYNQIMPLKNLNKMLQKVAVYQSTKKHKKAKTIVEEINSQESNISLMATLSGSKYSDVYRLMKTPKKRKVYKEYKQRFSNEQKIEATNIYLNEEVSYCLPDRKYSKLRSMSCTIGARARNPVLDDVTGITVLQIRT